MEFEQILSEAKRLELPVRARLAKMILESLDEEEEAVDADVEAAWMAVAKARDEQMDADPSLALDAREELQRLIVRYGG